MVFQVNLLIYLYMTICICLLLFNLVYFARDFFKRKRDPEMVRKYMNKLCEMLETSGVEKISQKEEKFWTRKLSKSSGLILFQQAVEELEAKGKQEDIEKWVRNNRDLFYKLSSAYMKKRGMEKALMAYIIEQHHLCGPGARDPFAIQMEWLVSDHSIYCRENALYALYAGGQPEHVIKAYHILTRMRIEHSSKMVTDGLLSFQGDRELLAEELWKNWTHYSTYYKICFVNFFRMISGNFTERLLIVLKDEENDRELRLAVIRYFRKYKYDKAWEYLCCLVEEWRESDWEYAALSALALESYPGKRTIDALKKGCESRNWYIRYNSAQSLGKLIDHEQKGKLIQNEKDIYAKEMMAYKFMGTEESTDDGCD